VEELNNETINKMNNFSSLLIFLK